MSGVGDLLLGFIKDDTHFGPLNVDNAASVSLVLSLDDADLITRLEVLANAADVHLKLFTEFDVLIIHGLEGDLSFLD